MDRKLLFAALASILETIGRSTSPEELEALFPAESASVLGNVTSYIERLKAENDYLFKLLNRAGEVARRAESELDRLRRVEAGAKDLVQALGLVQQLQAALQKTESDPSARREALLKLAKRIEESAVLDEQRDNSAIVPLSLIQELEQVLSEQSNPSPKKE